MERKPSQQKNSKPIPQNLGPEQTGNSHYSKGSVERRVHNTEGYR